MLLVIHHITNSTNFVSLGFKFMSMTTVTLKINERTKAGKALMAILSETFRKSTDGVEIVETDSKKLIKEKNSYNPEFVKMVLESAERGEYKEVDPKDVWGSLGLK